MTGRLTACLALVVLASCGNAPSRDIDTVAAEARQQIDALAADVGTEPVVLQDVITHCTPVIGTPART